MARASSSSPRIGLVLSGGGARGAYEVGVLRWIAEHRPDVLERVRVITGASVGAINGAFLAAHGLDRESVHALEEVWLGLHVERVMNPSPVRIARILGAGAARLFSKQAHSPAVGLFASGRFRQLLEEVIPFEGIPRQIREGRFDAVAVSSTEIGSGRTHVFVDHAEHMPTPRWPHDRSMEGFTTRLSLQHVLASAAIPLLFAPVQVGDYWYTDGGLRQNTPLSPALRLGAERLLVIRLEGPDSRTPAPGAFPGLGQLIGKMLNAIFLDRLTWDLDRLSRINDILEAGVLEFGPDFVERIGGELMALGRRPYKPVVHVAIKPSDDIGLMAGRLLRSPGSLNTAVSGPMRALLASDNLATADAASYILFDGAFARELLDLGYRDAAASNERLDALLVP